MLEIENGKQAKIPKARTKETAFKLLRLSELLSLNPMDI